MTIEVWRLCDARYAATMWTGLGAKTFGGRWNSPGVPLVYASATRSLAALEQLVHLVPPRILAGYVLASATIDESQVEPVDTTKLPVGWDRAVSGPATQDIGDRWVAAGRTLALAVPSIVVPGELNYLINPIHAEFARVIRSAPIAFAHDPRLA